MTRKRRLLIIRILVALGVLAIASRLIIHILRAGVPVVARPPAWRLIHADSPYLRAHARDLVRWRPWGQAAFAASRKLNKPIFLTVGYAACHWCRVMDRQSFRNPQIAALINRYFIPVVVDSEQRPDINHQMMAFVEISTGSGGWPLNVFLTPHGRPFAGGTYFPAKTAYGIAGLSTLLPKIHGLWLHHHGKLTAFARRVELVLNAMRRSSIRKSGKQNILTVCAADLHMLMTDFDFREGGFGKGPKFPQCPTLDFLLNLYHRTSNRKALRMVTQTLAAIDRGGIHDQLGGGFFRYAIDRKWRVPHYEKMLSDQAQLTETCLTVWRMNHHPRWAKVANSTLAFTLRDMQAASGRFYTALGADSRPVDGSTSEKDGAYYVWTFGQISHVLGQNTADFRLRYGIEPAKPGQAERGRPLHIAMATKAIAAIYHQPLAEVLRALHRDRQLLLATRRRRPHPLVDNKSITSWNAQMIQALAEAGCALGNPRYTQAAEKAAGFIQDHMYDARRGILFRSWDNGRASIPGMLSDYADTISALLALYQTTLHIQWYKFALQLQRDQDKWFYDARSGGYFTTPSTDTGVYRRWKNRSDGSTPSGNAVAVHNLRIVSALTRDPHWRHELRQTTAFYTAMLADHPDAMPAMLAALANARTPVGEIVIAGRRDSSGVEQMLRAVWRKYTPNEIVVGSIAGEGRRYLMTCLPRLAFMKMAGNRATAYVCRNFTCQAPTTSVARLRTLLSGMSR